MPQEYDLAERTASFAEQVIAFCHSIHSDHVSTPLLTQLVRSATSIGANYCEADEAGSKKEFKYRLSLCKRESKETQYWFRMVAVAEPKHKERARELWKEARELTLIFAAIHRKL